MKYGSLVNQIYAESKQNAPYVGQGVTELMYSDRHAGTIIEVSANGKQIVFQRDKAIRIDGHGMSDVQEYRYEPDPTAHKETARLAKNGRWYTKGGMANGIQVLIGHRREYYDYSF